MTFRPSKLLLACMPLLFCAFFCGCKKSAQSAPPAPTNIDTVHYTIKCWNKTAGQYTSFLSNNIPLKEWWDFGDGDTLLVKSGYHSSISHIYRAPGVYNVSLVVNGDKAHKVTQLDTIAPNFFFYHEGTPIEGGILSFHFPAFLPPGLSYLWDFGDGQSSTDSTPTHIYSNVGNYTVHLDISGYPKKPYEQIEIFKDPVYTKAMTMPRLWHGRSRDYNLIDSTLYNVRRVLPDTVFALTYINQLCVKFAWTTFDYDPDLSTGDAIVFVSKNSLPPSTVYYYFKKDSLDIFLYNIYGGSGTPITRNDTYWYSP
jgi:hypothetical protein